MMHARGRWVALLAMIVALSVAVGGLILPMPSAHAQLFGVSEQDEIKIGRQVEAQLAKTYGFVDDPAGLQRVRGIGLRLAHVSERPNLPWTYHIIADKSVNAIAAPGGFIFVTRALLPFVKSDDELGFVLGHETTHVAHRHAVELAQREIELQFGAALISRLLFGGSLTAYQLSSIASGMLAAKYSRDKEYEADHYGVIYARKIGYDPRASVSFFRRLQRLEQRSSAIGAAFASHPPTADRIKAVQNELRQMGYQLAAEESPPESVPAPAPSAPSPPAAAPPSVVSQPSPPAPRSPYGYGDK